MKGVVAVPGPYIYVVCVLVLYIFFIRYIFNGESCFKTSFLVSLILFFGFAFLVSREFPFEVEGSNSCFRSSYDMRTPKRDRSHEFELKKKKQTPFDDSLFYFILFYFPQQTAGHHLSSSRLYISLGLIGANHLL
jgi:hypothetical protein